MDMLGNYVGSLARAMITFCVSKEEVGKIFSFFAFVDGVLPSLSQLMYSAIFTVVILNHSNLLCETYIRSNYLIHICLLYLF